MHVHTDTTLAIYRSMISRWMFTALWLSCSCEHLLRNIVVHQLQSAGSGGQRPDVVIVSRGRVSRKSRWSTTGWLTCHKVQHGIVEQLVHSYYEVMIKFQGSSAGDRLDQPTSLTSVLQLGSAQVGFHTAEVFSCKCLERPQKQLACPSIIPKFAPIQPRIES